MLTVMRAVYSRKIVAGADGADGIQGRTQGTLLTITSITDDVKLFIGMECI